jgi:hypothetical protein
MAAINQAHEDRGLPRPALGHYFRLARAGWRALEGEERDAQGSRSTRMPVPAEVMFDILQPSGKNSRYFHTQKGMKQTHKGMKNHCFSRKHLFHTLKKHFIPLCNCFIP